MGRGISQSSPSDEDLSFMRGSAEGAGGGDQAFGEIAPYVDPDGDDIPLNDKERKFVENVAIHGMTKQAACLKAGFLNRNYVGHLMSRPNIRAAIAAQRKINAERLNITRDKILQGLTDAIDQAKLLADPSAQIAGWREVAKICGVYEPEQNKMTTLQKRIVEKFENLTDEELSALVAKEVKGEIIDASEIES